MTTFNSRDAHFTVNESGEGAMAVDPHMIETRTVFRYSTNQTNTTVLQPPSGKKLCVRGISSRTVANTGVIKMDFATSVIPVYDHYVSVQVADGQDSGHIMGAVDEPLTINTTTGANAVSISITYTFHDAVL